MTDYDTPPTATIELDPELANLPHRLWARLEPGLADVDEDGSWELPGFEVADEELTVAVIGIRAEEFRCCTCFLVLHRRLHAGSRNGQDICRDCA
jgi:hypothetical protein